MKRHECSSHAKRMKRILARLIVRGVTFAREKKRVAMMFSSNRYNNIDGDNVFFIRKFSGDIFLLSLRNFIPKRTRRPHTLVLSIVYYFLVFKLIIRFLIMLFGLLTSLQTSIDPKTTCSPSKKFSPMIMTVDPPAVQPSLGDIAFMHGVCSGIGGYRPKFTTQKSYCN